MATTKRKTASGRDSADSSYITKKALREMLEQARAERISEEVPTVVESPVREVRDRRGRARPKGKIAPKQYVDSLDEFELSLLRHGINMEDLRTAARSYEAGTKTPYAKLAHAILQWWCSIPIGGRRVVWVDPASGYTEATLPKFSTAEGQDLLSRGLAGACWVSTRKHLLEARAWAKRMMQLTPVERLREPLQFGDERVSKR